MRGEIRPELTLSDFAEELVMAFGSAATTQAVNLMLVARQQGLKHQEAVLTCAAIMLCGARYRSVATR